jgi:hypothetical protein
MGSAGTVLALGIWDALEVIYSPGSDYIKSPHVGLLPTGRPLAMPRPLGENKMHPPTAPIGRPYS